MSNNRYVIRNCPCFVEGIAIKGNEQKIQTCNNHTIRELTYCADCIDCKLKQIVEKCKKEIRVYRNTLLPNDGTNTLHFGRQSFAYDILQMLDIEEINSKIKRSECLYGGIDCAWCTEECE